VKAHLSIVLLLAIAQSPPGAVAQDRTQQTVSLLAVGQELIEKEEFPRAEQVLREALQLDPENAEGHFLLGFALAKQGKLPASREEFKKTLLLQPNHFRARTELAGVEFKLGNNAEAVRNLRKALALNSDDEYAKRFLATLLYLDGKKTEALHYWNMLGEPRIGVIEYRASPSVRAQLLDRLFGLNEKEIFRREQVLDMRWKQHRFDLGPYFHWQLTPRSQGEWGLEIAVPANQALSSTKLFLLQTAIRAPLYKEIAVEYPMELRSGRQLSSAFRWDGPRKRIRASARFPFPTSSLDAMGFAFDLRDEDWVESYSATQFLLKSQQVSTQYERLFTGRKSLSFHGGYEHQQLSFDDARQHPANDPHYMRIGLEWNQLVGLTVADTMQLKWGARLDTYTGFGGKESRSSQVTSKLGVDWALEERSRSELSVALGAGLSSENLPLDHYFILGVGQEDPLPLRAHPTVDKGRKGNSPMGRQYFLVNLELQRRLLRWKLLEISGSVFSDTGIIAQRPFVDPAHQCFQDLGFGLRFGAMGQEWVEILFGFDLRTSSFHLWLGVPLKR
jgi:hypothetical protein